MLSKDQIELLNSLYEEQIITCINQVTPIMVNVLKSTSPLRVDVDNTIFNPDSHYILIEEGFHLTYLMLPNTNAVKVEFVADTAFKSLKETYKYNIEFTNPSPKGKGGFERLPGVLTKEQLNHALINGVYGKSYDTLIDRHGDFYRACNRFHHFSKRLFEVTDDIKRKAKSRNLLESIVVQESI